MDTRSTSYETVHGACVIHSIHISCLALLISFGAGCYQVHGREGPSDSGLRTGVDAHAHDAGPSRPDARTDAGPPLPAEPDPDLGPDSRPSDYPEADDWEDPPDIGEDDPCCVLGEPHLIASRDGGVQLARSSVRVAWGPGGWGVLATRLDGTARPLVLWRLAAEGEPLGEQTLELPTRILGFNPTAVSLRYAEGRWAVGLRVSTSGPAREHWARLFDRELRAASPWHFLGEGSSNSLDLARLSHGDLWLGVSASAGRRSVRPFDDRRTYGTVEHAAFERTSRVRAAGLRSRVAVLSSHPSELPGVTGEIMVVGPGPDHRRLGTVATELTNSTQVTLTALRDLVLVADIERGGGVRVEVLDPFGLTSVTGARTIGSSPFGPTMSEWGEGVGVAGSDKLGLAGVCWGLLAGPDFGSARIMFRLVGPDANPRGSAVVIVESHFRRPWIDCAVGSDERGFLVAWWNGSELWARRVDLAP